MSDTYVDDVMKRYAVERADDWMGWISKIPFLPEMPSGFQIKVIPPFGGALVRFQVQKPGNHVVSVYLDVADRLGCYGAPYWEVHPYFGDVGRCDMDNVSELVKMIGDSAP